MAWYFFPFSLNRLSGSIKCERLHLLRERRTRRRSKQGLRLQSSGARPSRTQWTFSSKAARSPLHRATSFLCMWTARRSAPPRSRVPSGPSSKRYCGSSSCHCGRRSEETAALRQQQRLERSRLCARHHRPIARLGTAIQPGFRCRIRPTRHHNALESFGHAHATSGGGKANHRCMVHRSRVQALGLRRILLKRRAEWGMIANGRLRSDRRWGHAS